MSDSDYLHLLSPHDAEFMRGRLALNDAMQGQPVDVIYSAPFLHGWVSEAWFWDRQAEKGYIRA